MDDIYRAKEQNNPIALAIFLDLSKAFDTLNHDVIIYKLKSQFNFSNDAISWIQSYLCKRTMRVKIDDAKSSPRSLKYGVPQGSILGPLLFILTITYGFFQNEGVELKKP